MKIGAAIFVLAMLYLFYPSYELQIRATTGDNWTTAGNPTWGNTIWSRDQCRKQGRALRDMQWRCRQNNPWHLLFQTSTRYDPEIRDGQEVLSGDASE
ncbi:MAG: hypothetical protein IPN63_02430 [Gammaproteobacteria bacterium]|jgi:hypothetical protein|nr:hypothetical protein [Gammaproteobacteria bacterium]MBK8133494.1 hypothetical protein [Gammaproteobacteria bacterium]MBK9426299.1 hypothetical protein [Gammaproteobacteria bacterium]